MYIITIQAIYKPLLLEQISKHNILLLYVSPQPVIEYGTGLPEFNDRLPGAETNQYLCT